MLAASTADSYSLDKTSAPWHARALTGWMGLLVVDTNWGLAGSRPWKRTRHCIPVHISLPLLFFDISPTAEERKRKGVLLHTPRFLDSFFRRGGGREPRVVHSTAHVPMSVLIPPFLSITVKTNVCRRTPFRVIFYRGIRKLPSNHGDCIASLLMFLFLIHSFCVSVTTNGPGSGTLGPFLHPPTLHCPLTSPPFPFLTNTRNVYQGRRLGRCNASTALHPVTLSTRESG